MWTFESYNKDDDNTSSQKLVRNSFGASFQDIIEISMNDTSD